MIITHGCSFTRYRWECWPHYIKFFDKNIAVKNLGMSASGNETISRMAVNSSMRFKNIKKIYIMWSGYNRYEVVENQSLFEKIADATYSRWDPDFQWHVWFGGHPVREHHKYYQKYFLNEDQNRFRTLERILYTQRHLESKEIDYTMMIFKEDVLKHDPKSVAEKMVYNEIDWTKFLFYEDKKGLWEFAQENYPNAYVDGDEHPLPLAHYEWTKQIIFGNKEKLPNEYEQQIINRTNELKKVYAG
jgi:hypothetical protein